MRILMIVTNDLNYDQRMIRICNSLNKAGHEVELIGVRFSGCSLLQPKIYRQKRLRVFLKSGIGFYAEYNVRLFFYLLFQKADAICSIDLDTIMPVYVVSRLRGIKRVHDAHEYFSQMKEVVTRRKVYRFWHWAEKTFLPKFPCGYTVSKSIANEFESLYSLNYEVIINVPVLRFDEPKTEPHEQEENRLIIYQGSVNHARGFEFLIPAMDKVNGILHIYGDGNFMQQAKRLVEQYQLTEKIIFKGKVSPDELKQITPMASVAVNLVEPLGQSQIFSLANKFFDYIHAEVPQVTMNFPEYTRVNVEYRVALLMDKLCERKIACALNKLLDDKNLQNELRANCRQAKLVFNWQEEEKKLLGFYKNLEND